MSALDLPALRAHAEHAKANGEWDLPLGMMAIGCDEVLGLIDRILALESVLRDIHAYHDASTDQPSHVAWRARIVEFPEAIEAVMPELIPKPKAATGDIPF